MLLPGRWFRGPIRPTGSIMARWARFGWSKSWNGPSTLRRSSGWSPTTGPAPWCPSAATSATTTTGATVASLTYEGHPSAEAVLKDVAAGDRLPVRPRQPRGRAPGRAAGDRRCGPGGGRRVGPSRGGLPGLRRPRRPDQGAPAGVEAPGLHRRHGRVGELRMTLIDTYGRVHRDLRVSVTDRCNLRCTYCMPPDFADWMPGDHLLSHRRADDGDLGRRRRGRHEHPADRRRAALRPDIVEIVARINALPTPPRINLTTQRPEARRAGAAARRRGPRAGQHQPRHPRRGAVQAADVPRPLRPTCIAGIEAALAAGLHPGQGQHRPHARHQRRRGGADAAARRRERLAPALHRADAARRAGLVGPRGDGHGRGDPRPARVRVHPRRPCPVEVRRRPRSSSSTTVPPRWASSPASASPSAPRATGCG